jgi:hypothetical protein
MIACVSILAGLGCRAKPKPAPAKAPTRSDFAGAWQSKPLPARAESTLIKQGATPLVYLVETGATVRVRDENTKRDLAVSFAAARSIVRVDASRGVIYGDDTLAPGPLPADHLYSIFVEPAGENVARQGTFQPRPPKAR